MKLTESEWRVMNALWAEHPATARQVRERLPAGVSWAYTTVKTLLARLVEKKVVRGSKRGNTSLYEPCLSRSSARRSALRSLANQAFDGAFGPLMHFLVEESSLSPAQQDELMRMLEQHKNKG